MTRRSEQLKAVAQEFLDTHKAWTENGNQPTPPQEYWDAVDSVVESFGDGDIPADCRNLNEAVEQLQYQRDEFDNRPDIRNLLPEDSFWGSVEQLNVAMQDFDRKSKGLPPLESIASLKQLPYISDLQIAKIYGFKDHNGNWRPEYVQRELDKPGSITKTPGAMDGQNWSDPRLKYVQANGDTAAKNAAAIEDKKQHQRRRQPCAETPKELWEQNVSAKQAAKMLLKDQEEVESLFSKFDKERDEALKSGGIVSAQTQHIRELAAKGKGVSAIAQELKIEPKTVSEALQQGAAA